MLVTLSRWLVTFGVDCEKALRPRGAERRGGGGRGEAEALGGRASKGEGWTQTGAPTMEQVP